MTPAAAEGIHSAAAKMGRFGRAEVGWADRRYAGLTMLGPEQVDLLTNIVWWTALVEVVLFFVRATDADENPAR
jgi:hypothetical protein